MKPPSARLKLQVKSKIYEVLSISYRVKWVHPAVMKRFFFAYIYTARLCLRLPVDLIAI